MIQNIYTPVQMAGEITLRDDETGILYPDTLSDHAWVKLLMGDTKITEEEVNTLGDLASDYGLGLAFVGKAYNHLQRGEA